MKTTAVKLGAILACAVSLALAGDLQAQTHYETVHTFSGNQGRPLAALTQGADGRLYGTTVAGGFFGKGSIYATDGAGGVAMLHEFSGPDGEAPRGRLALGTDDKLYGTTSLGGASGFGTVFRVSADGTFQTLIEFNGSNGAFPQAGLTRASDGHFYGTTASGGVDGIGTIFRLTTDGTLTTIASFNGSNGTFPNGSLIQGADGDLYGTTRQGGEAGLGTVFRSTLDGIITTVASFDGANGADPSDGPMQASDLSFYGTTALGGAVPCDSGNGCGTIYRITAEGLETIHDFSGGDGALPSGELREFSDLHIYGTTQEGGDADFGTVFRLSSDGEFESVASFTGEAGNFPGSGVIQASNGAIYGTTESGGPGQYGTVFELLPGGGIRTALSFTGSIGASPSSSLVQAGDGNLYGTTLLGGDHGYGSVFRLTPDGMLTTIASFDLENGATPSGGMVLASDGYLYGTTETGGATGDGTLFRLSLDGTLTSIASFDLSVNGASPSGRLIEGTDGFLYGTALFGLDFAPGAVFRVNRLDGAITASAFAMDESNGVFPSAGVVEAPDGSFYGTAEMGGENGAGTIFHMLPSGEISTAASFDFANGAAPASPLLVGSDGSLYGTASMGGETSDGTLFRMSLDDHTLTPLASFDFFSTGTFPYLQGVVDGGGFLYGSTSMGGVNGFGTVYRWSVDGGMEVVHDFDGVIGDGPNTTVVKAMDGSLYGTAAGPQGGIIYRITFENALASLEVAPASAIYGGSANLSATLSVSGSPVPGVEITFSLNGVPVGSATTGADGVATLSGVSVAGIDAGSYAGAISASSASADGVPAAAAAGDLTIAPAASTIAMADASYVYDGLPHPAIATVTGVGGETLGPLTFTYNGAALAPVEPGSYTVLASYAGSVNYQPASATATITITAAPPGLTGLVAAYAFEEGAGLFTGDASGRGHGGRQKRPQWAAAGRFGRALDFNGVDDWVTIADEADLDMQSAITIEAWVNPRALSGWNTIALKEGDGRMSYALYANDWDPRPAGYVRVNFIDQSVTGRSRLALNTWSHVAMTYSGSMMRLYVNGVEVSRRSMSGKIQTVNGPLRIGGNSIWGEYFNGLIDEVRLYKRELNAAEITRDMNTPIAHEEVAPTVSITSPADGATLSGMPAVSVTAGDNLAVSSVQLRVDGVDVGQALNDAPYTFSLDAANGDHVVTAVARDVAGNIAVSAPVRIKIANTVVADYRFDEASGTVVTDASGRNNTGSISGGASRVNDATRGRVMSFNGSDGLVTAADSASLDLTTGLTIEAWVRPTVLSGWRTVVMKESGSGLAYALYASDDVSKPSGFLRIQSIDESIQSRKKLTLNAWNHLAMTYDGATMRMFINGVEVESRREGGAIQVTGGKLRIGGNKIWGEYFKGQMDDVLIYDVAVGEAQIKADMNR